MTPDLFDNRPTLTSHLRIFVPETPAAPPAPDPAVTAAQNPPAPEKSAPAPVRANRSLELGERAFALRRQNLSWHEIAAKLGQPLETVFAAMLEYWKTIASKTSEPARLVIDAELATLEALQRRWLPVALEEPAEIVEDPAAKKGAASKLAADAIDLSLKAFDRVLKIMERRAKLLGLEDAQEAEGKLRHITLADARERLKTAGIAV